MYHSIHRKKNGHLELQFIEFMKPELENVKVSFIMSSNQFNGQIHFEVELDGTEMDTLKILQNNKKEKREELALADKNYELFIEKIRKEFISKNQS